MATMSQIYNMIDDNFYPMEGTAEVLVDSAFAGEDRPWLFESFCNNMRQDG
jgi:hypothetical protein